MDKLLLTRFSEQASEKLSLTDESNPFKKHILPMARENIGLMHSVLFLASSCFLATGPGGSDEARLRQEHHRVMALQFLMQGGPKSLEDGSSLAIGGTQSDTAGTAVTVVDQPQPESSALTRTNNTDPLTLPVALAQALIMCLETVAAGNTDGTYRVSVDDNDTSSSQADRMCRYIWVP